jgi:hypothetical protein
MADRIPMMPPKVFWDLIEASKRDAIDDQFDALHLLLVTLRPDEVAGFDNRLSHYQVAANRRDLWRAAALLCTCRDEASFRCFCLWLMLRGRAAFDGALADPDSLADFAECPTRGEYHEAQHLTTSGQYAWEELNNGADVEEYFALTPEPESPWWPTLAPAGWDVFDQGEVRRRLPRLAALHRDGAQP